MHGHEVTSQTKQGIGGRVQRLVLGAAVAALLAADAAGAGAGVVGYPSQWGAANADTAPNFTKVENKNSASVGVGRAGTRTASSSGPRVPTFADDEVDTTAANPALNCTRVEV